MDAQTISCMVIAGVGIGLILLSIPFFLRLKKIRRKCSEMTTGKVIDYYVKRNGDMGSSIAPIVEYSVNGKTYKVYRRYKGIKSVKKIPPKQSGNLPFRSPLLRKSIVFFLFLRLLRCFSSPGSRRNTMDSCYVT